MRYAQKKSFSFREWRRRRRGVETYLSNIGLKLMLLSVAIRYFYCSRLCIIFLPRTPLLSSLPPSPPSPSPSGPRHPPRANFNFDASAGETTPCYDTSTCLLLALFMFLDSLIVGAGPLLVRQAPLVEKQRRTACGEGEKIRQIRWRHLTHRSRLIGAIDSRLSRKVSSVERPQMRD